MAVIYSDYHREDAAKKEAANRERPVKLFYRFHNKAERDSAVRAIESDREFAELFSQMTDFGNDPSSAHEDDGLALR